MILLGVLTFELTMVIPFLLRKQFKCPIPTWKWETGEVMCPDHAKCGIGHYRRRQGRTKLLPQIKKSAISIC
jgi:hypothetical protein